MFCKHCGKQIPDDAAFCAYCGGKLDASQPAQPVQSAQPVQEHQVNYTTITSDRSKKKALGLLCTGLGLHLFYVGKIFRGIMRFIIGLLGWIVILCGISAGNAEEAVTFVLTGIIWLSFFNLFDFIRLLTGNFRDSSGAYLRH